MNPTNQKSTRDRRERAAALKNASRLLQSAKRIRATKDVCRAVQRSRRHAGGIQALLADIRREHRHRHIAYCELRGTPRERIEQPRPDNLPSEALIRKLKEEMSAFGRAASA